MSEQDDSTETAAALARGRGHLYAFFAEQTLTPPISDDCPPNRLTLIWSEVSELLGPDTTGAALEYLASEDFSEDALKQEFQDLLRVPGARYLAPIQSVYEGLSETQDRSSLGTLRGRAWSAACEFYRVTGFEMPNSTSKEADHIGNELGFLRALCQAEADAWERGDQEAADEARRQQGRFIAEHLLCWLPVLLKRLASVEPLPYYDGLFRSIASFLEIERANLNGDRS